MYFSCKCPLHDLVYLLGGRHVQSSDLVHKPCFLTIIIAFGEEVEAYKGVTLLHTLLSVSSCAYFVHYGSKQSFSLQGCIDLLAQVLNYWSCSSAPLYFLSASYGWMEESLCVLITCSYHGSLQDLHHTKMLPFWCLYSVCLEQNGLEARSLSQLNQRLLLVFQ